MDRTRVNYPIGRWSSSTATTPLVEKTLKKEINIERAVWLRTSNILKRPWHHLNSLPQPPPPSTPASPPVSLSLLLSISVFIYIYIYIYNIGSIQEFSYFKIIGCRCMCSKLCKSLFHSTPTHFEFGSNSNSVCLRLSTL